MNLIDTHTHLYLEQFDGDIDAVIERAKSAGVSRMLLPNIDLSTVESMSNLVERGQGLFVPMMGLHPCSVKSDFVDVLNPLKSALESGIYCAVGEIGIDLHWDKSTLEIQKEAFRVQIMWAKELDLPIVIHARESLNEIFEILDELNDESLCGVFHCFSGSVDQAQKILEYGGFYLGIGGVLTFKNAGLDKIIAQLPLEKLLLETDSPYLTPVPFRGKRNESSYIRFVADKLAQLTGKTAAEIGEITSENAKYLFRLSTLSD